MSKSIQKVLAKVNKVDIVAIENGEKLIPIKPICEAIGVAPNGQIEKTKEDQILGSVGKLSLSTGSDGKQYEMYCLPLKFVFGWLFTINPKNVNPEAREAVIRYKLECYNALYDYFALSAEFIEIKQVEIDKLLEEINLLKDNFKFAKTQLEEANKKLNDVRKRTLADYLAEKRQLNLFAAEVSVDQEGGEL